ncbi:branched-chain amino acid ABC transporter permease [Bradyrhizobium sp.]|uniref:branched-chain amino acid ABC transporter permease n=1 Tax=Bradyrhizobium sp. TaxID=376 RepID=UPI0039E44C97
MKDKSLIDRIGGNEIVSLLLVAAALLVPVYATNAAVISLFTQILIALMGALSVYIMLRMDLMSFAVPAFMAIGGYAVAIVSARYDVTDVFALAAVSLLVPMLIALPIGALILRLRGVYFVLVTFVIAEIMPLLLFETPTLTGGSNGISGLPPVVFFGMPIEDNNKILLMTTVLAVVAVLGTIGLTRYYRHQFDAIKENELLAQSLGLTIWRYKVIGFCAAAGLAGLGGFCLVEMLITAHPSSFQAISSVNYVAYTVVGGQGALLGAVVGSALLVWASNLFSLQGEFSQGLFGILLMLAVLFAKGGLIGSLQGILARSRKFAPAARSQGAEA